MLSLQVLTLVPGRTSGQIVFHLFSPFFSKRTKRFSQHPLVPSYHKKGSRTLSRPLANPRQETQFATGRDRPAQKIWYESQSSRPTGDSFRFFSWRYWR